MRQRFLRRSLLLIVRVPIHTVQFSFEPRNGTGQGLGLARHIALRNRRIEISQLREERLLSALVNCAPHLRRGILQAGDGLCK